MEVPAGLRLRVDDLETGAVPPVSRLTGDPGEGAPAWAAAGHADDRAHGHAGRFRGLRR